MMRKILVFTLCLLLPGLALAAADNGTIDTAYKYAWGENLGWINFKTNQASLTITDTRVTGYAWSQQLGWINFSPSTGGVTNNCSGTLGGQAWSSALGWINLSGVTINNNGRFVGVANVGGTQAGRINFDCTNCRVETDWRPCALRQNCGNGIVESGETCDDGANNGLCPKTCSTSCQTNSCQQGGNSILIPKASTTASGTDSTSSEIITPSKPSKKYDVVVDGVVDIIDFNVMMINWGTQGYNDADLNHDYVVDFFDFNILMANWGKTYRY